jgi:hypothetical protein
MRITVALEIGERTVVEQLTTTEDFRGDYRGAIQQIAGRIELGTYGPQQKEDGYMFDHPLQMRMQE